MRTLFLLCLMNLHLFASSEVPTDIACTQDTTSLHYLDKEGPYVTSQWNEAFPFVTAVKKEEATCEHLFHSWYSHAFLDCISKGNIQGVKLFPFTLLKLDREQPWHKTIPIASYGDYVCLGAKVAKVPVEPFEMQYTQFSLAQDSEQGTEKFEALVRLTSRLASQRLTAQARRVCIENGWNDATSATISLNLTGTEPATEPASDVTASAIFECL